MVRELPIGTEMAGFSLEGKIGQGGFGITYLARELRSDDRYAIKEYLPEDFAQRDPSGLVSYRPGHREPYSRGKSAFLEEADILKSLPRRRGLVRVRGAFERFGTAYCVMEYIEGDSLDRMARRLIARDGHVPQPLLTELALSVLWALDAIHAEDMIHRDVKPANVMLRPPDEPVLIDFGAARKLSRDIEPQLVFTRSYAALEQLPVEMTGFGRPFEEGPWSDLYSLSVVLYELVAPGRPPDVPSRSKAKLADREDPYVPLARMIAGKPHADAYSPHFLDAIDRGCALMPSARWRTARDFAEALAPGGWEEMRRREIERSERRPSPPGPPGATPPRRRRGAGPAALLVIALLLGAVAVGVLIDIAPPLETF